MKEVVGQDDVAKEREIKTIANVVEDAQEHIAGALRAEKPLPAVSTEGDEMQVTAAVAAYQWISY